MAVTANSIITPQTIISGTCKLTSANSNSLDTPSVVVQLLAGQTNGARITRVQAVPAATVTATDVQLYADNGGTKRFIKAVAMGAQTIGASNTAAVAPTDFGFSESNPLILAASESLYMGLAVAQTSVHGRCEGGAY